MRAMRRGCGDRVAMLCVGLAMLWTGLPAAQGDMNVAVFDGTGRIIIAEDAVFQQHFDAMTIEFWMKPTRLKHPVDNWTMIVHRNINNEYVGQSLWFAGFSDKDALIATFNANNGSVNVTDGETTHSPALNEWMHVAATWTNGITKVYTNGVLCLTHTGTATAMDTNAAKLNSLALGGTGLGGATYRSYAGQLSDVRIWDAVRTSQQIADNLNLRLAGTEPNLIGYWPLDEDTGTTAADKTTNGNNGTLTDNVTWTTTSDLTLLSASGFGVADQQTGSAEYTNSNVVDVVNLVVPDGYDEYQINEIDNAGSLDVNDWISTNTAPTIATFAVPSPEGAVTLYAWFRDTGAVNPIQNTTATITYVRTTADVTAVATGTLSRVSWGAEWPALVTLAAVEAGSSSSIGIYSTAISAPEDATLGDPTLVTLNDTGTYTVTLTVTDMAGNTATDTTTVTVTDPPSPHITAWDGGGDGSDWFDHDNWTNYAPGPGAEASVGTGSVVLDRDTAELSSFTITGGTVTFQNWDTRLRAATVALNGGTLTHAGPYDYDPGVMSNRVYIVCTDLTVAAGTRINVQGKGFTRGQGPGSGGNDQGGTHGGRGRNNPKLPYGSIELPQTPGSGGPVIGGTLDGVGGGVVRIEATGTVTVTGVITANGNAGSGNHNGAGGAGGSILIECDTFAGNGTLTARGGGAGHGRPGGGGGRIAVHYNQASSPTVKYDLRGAYGGVPAIALLDGDLGTLYLSDSSFFLQETMNLGGGRFTIPGLPDTWSPANLTINNLAVGFPEDLTIDVAGDFTISGSGVGVELMPGATLDVGGNLAVSGGGQILTRTGSGISVDGNLTLSSSHLWIYRPTPFHVGGDFSQTGSSRTYFYGAPTVVDGPDYVTLIAVGGTLSVADTAAVNVFSDTVNGGSPLFRVGHFNLATNALFNGTARGFAAGQGPGAGGYRIGGTHGGQGGANTALPNGSMDNPVIPGSGGNGHPGGSVVRIDASPSGTVTLEGTIQVDGHSQNSHHTGYGAGGSINIRCHTLAGSGTLSAKGGTSTSANTRGGGGGRVALMYVASTYDGDIHVPFGTGSWDPQGLTGTVFRCQSVIADAGVPGGTGPELTTVWNPAGNDVMVERSITQWDAGVRVRWTDASFTTGGIALANTATYTLSGLEPNGYARIFIDEVQQMEPEGADGDGKVTISGVTLDHTVTVNVELAPPGSLFIIR